VSYHFIHKIKFEPTFKKLIKQLAVEGKWGFNRALDSFRIVLTRLLTSKNQEHIRFYIGSFTLTCYSSPLRT